MSVPAIPDVPIHDLLVDLGYRSPQARQAARAEIEAAGLTSSRKKRIATSKRDAVRSLLASRLAMVCLRATCRASAANDGRRVLDAERPIDCGVCGGQQNRTEIERAIGILLERGLRRVVVVGGSPGTHDELRSLVGTRLGLRLLPGTERRHRRDAKVDLAWADLVVVWGGTELDHKVSKLYTDNKDERVVTCVRRGIAALAATMIEAARRR